MPLFHAVVKEFKPTSKMSGTLVNSFFSFSRFHHKTKTNISCENMDDGNRIK